MNISEKKRALVNILTRLRRSHSDVIVIKTSGFFLKLNYPIITIIIVIIILG